MPLAELEAALLAETPTVAIIPDVRMRTPPRPIWPRSSGGALGIEDMSPAGLIPALQSDALVREIERQLAEENVAILIASAQRDAQSSRGASALSRARPSARRDRGIAREGERRLARAKAQLETEARGRAQQQAAQAVSDALPLLRETLEPRWRDQEQPPTMDRPRGAALRRRACCPVPG